MDLFGKNFLHVRNNHILPKIDYGIARKNIEFWSLKDVFSNKLLSLNKLSGNKSIDIEIPKADYYKAIHCDIELFMSKIIVQYLDFKNQTNISPTWSFVTLYYLTFFNATCIFRFLDKGFIFFTREHIKRFEDFSLAVNSDIISLDSGNYFFALKGENDYGDIVITLSFKGDNVHKSTWLQLESTLQIFNQSADSQENLVYSLFLNHFSKFKSEYPSNLRNKLNYNGDSSLLDIDYKISCVELQEINNSFATNLAKIDTNTINHKNQIKSISFLASYLFEFNQKLYKEYIERSNFGKDFENERKKYFHARRNS